MLFSIVVILEQSVKFLCNKSFLEKFELFITYPWWVPELDRNMGSTDFMFIYLKKKTF